MFYGANLTDSKWGNNDITGCDFRGANLSRVDWSRIRNIKQAFFDDRTIFTGTKLPRGGVTVETLRQQRPVKK